MEFFMDMIPPTVTAQEHQVKVVNGKPIFYEPQRLKEAKRDLMIGLSKAKPAERLDGPLYLEVAWCFPKGRHRQGEPRITKPDTDNLEKMLKDCMTLCGYWNDDAQVCIEHVTKAWSDPPGIYIRLERLIEQK